MTLLTLLILGGTAAFCCLVLGLAWAYERLIGTGAYLE